MNQFEQDIQDRVMEKLSFFGPSAEERLRGRPGILEALSGLERATSESAPAMGGLGAGAGGLLGAAGGIPLGMMLENLKASIPMGSKVLPRTILDRLLFRAGRTVPRRIGAALPALLAMIAAGTYGGASLGQRAAEGRRASRLRSAEQGY